MTRSWLTGSKNVSRSRSTTYPSLEAETKNQNLVAIDHQTNAQNGGFLAGQPGEIGLPLPPLSQGTPRLTTNSGRCGACPRSQIFASWSQIFASWSQIFALWRQVFASWSQIFASRSQIFASWSQIFALWRQVFASRRQIFASRSPPTFQFCPLSGYPCGVSSGHGQFTASAKPAIDAPRRSRCA